MSECALTLSDFLKNQLAIKNFKAMISESDIDIDLNTAVATKIIEWNILDKMFPKKDYNINTIQNDHYCTFSQEIIIKGLVDQEIHKMQKFVEFKTFAEFIKLFDKVLSRLQEEDIDSLGLKNQTPNATEFYDLWKTLEANGFCTLKGDSINFWNGREGFLRAFTEDYEHCHAHVPALKAMGLIALTLSDSRLGYKPLPFDLNKALSRLYALSATGEVNVYISTAKESEPAGFSVSNDFWSAELPVLQTKLHSGEVSAIYIHLYDHIKECWLPPKNVNTKEADDIPLVRKHAYPDFISSQYKDSKIAKECKISSELALKMVDLMEVGSDEIPFEEGISNYQDRTDWQERSPPRPFITWAAMKKLSVPWANYAKAKVLAKKITPILK